MVTKQDLRKYALVLIAIAFTSLAQRLVDLNWQYQYSFAFFYGCVAVGFFGAIAFSVLSYKINYE